MGIKAEFSKHGAVLKNVQWSVSAWRDDGTLVVCPWAHHWRKSGVPGEVEYVDRLSRWRGSGNNELRRNLEKAVARGSPLRLVVVTTPREYERIVDAGYDDDQAEKVRDIPKEHHAVLDVVGRVAEFDGDRFVYRFRRTEPGAER
jgi:hypothetical protein